MPAQLGRFTSFALPGKAACVIREWSEDDDAYEALQLRGAILQLSEESVVLRELAQEVAKQVDDQGAILEEVAQDVAEAKRNVQDGVHALVGAKEEQAKTRPSKVGAVVGGVGLVIGVASGAGVAGIVARGVLAGAVSYLAAGKVSDWELGVLKKMQADLESSLGWRNPIAQDADVLIKEGEKAQHYFMDLASCEWTDFRGPVELFNKASGHLYAQYTESKARPSRVMGNCAFKTSFSVELSARDAWRIVDNLRVQGAMDPGCCAWWTRPVEKRGAENGVTSVRYAMYTKWGGKMAREFVSVCRSCRMPSADGRELYVCAVTSLDPEVLDALQFPFVHSEASGQTTRGHIYACGVSFTETSDTMCRVEVLGDVDPKNSRVANFVSNAGDHEVKASTMETAEFIKAHLFEGAEQKKWVGSDECAGPAPAPGEPPGGD